MAQQKCDGNCWLQFKHGFKNNRIELGEGNLLALFIHIDPHLTGYIPVRDVSATIQSLLAHGQAKTGAPQHCRVSQAGPSARGQAGRDGTIAISIRPEGGTGPPIPQEGLDKLIKDFESFVHEQIASGGVVDVGALCQPLVSIEDGVAACIACVHPSHFFDKPCL